MDMTPASRLAYAPILLGVAFIATLFIVAESGYKRIHEASQMISAAEERQDIMSRYLRVVLDAESAQRGFLLTEDTRYLRGFDPAVRSLDPLLDRIVDSTPRFRPRRGRRQGPGPALDHRQESGRDAGLAAPLWRGRSGRRALSSSTPTSASAR